MTYSSTPFGGINLNNTNTMLFQDTDAWERWFGRVMVLIDKYDIDMWSYINCNWDKQPMWHNIGFGDTRLSSNTHVMKKWQHYVIKSKGNQTFLLGNSLDCGFKTQIATSAILDPSFHRDYTLQNMLQFSVFVLLFYLFVFLLRKVIVSINCSSKIQSTRLEQRPILSNENTFIV